MSIDLDVVEYPDVPGIQIFLLWDIDLVRVRIDEPSASAPATGVEQRWTELTAANPKLFNGAILSVLQMKHAARYGTLDIAAMRSDYRSLVTQDRADTGIRQLSLTACIQGVGDDGRSYTLFGRRGHQTRLYGGMWEIGPSGGIDPPAAGVPWLEPPEVAAQLHREISEEMGQGLSVDIEGVDMVVFDPVARSYDLVFRCAARGPVTGGAIGTHNWEYHSAMWIPADEIAEFDSNHANAIIPPTRAMLRANSLIPGVPGAWDRR